MAPCWKPAAEERSRRAATSVHRACVPLTTWLLIGSSEPGVPLIFDRLELLVRLSLSPLPFSLLLTRAPLLHFREQRGCLPDCASDAGAGASRKASQPPASAEEHEKG